MTTTLPKLSDLCLNALTGKQKTTVYELAYLYPSLDIENKVTQNEQDLKSQLCDEIDELYWDQLFGVYREETRAKMGYWELPNVKPSRLGQSIWVEDCPDNNPYSFYLRSLGISPTVTHYSYH